jgi:hypothetical protein
MRGKTKSDEKLGRLGKIWSEATWVGKNEWHS